MKKELGLLGILVLILVVGAVVVVSWKSPKPPTTPIPTPPGEGVTEVTSYFDGTLGYDCSRPIRVTMGTASGQVVGSTVEIQIPVDPNEAKLFCHSTYVIENKGKIKVLQRPEVLELISHYEYKDVNIKALEFEYIEDKEYVHRLLPDYQDQEIGCIIVLQTPNEKLIYLEDEDLETFAQLDEATFERYLSQVSEADRKLFEDNLQ